MTNLPSSSKLRRSAGLGAVSWLVLDGDELDHERPMPTPLASGKRAVYSGRWEHAYYYYRMPAGFRAGVPDHLVNWDFVAQQPVGRWMTVLIEARFLPEIWLAAYFSLYSILEPCLILLVSN